MKSRTDFIALSDCRDRHLYEIDARNFSYGVYFELKKGFVGIRTKFGDSFLDCETHWDHEDEGTAKPLKLICKIPENSSFDYKSTELFNWLKGQNKKLLK